MMTKAQKTLLTNARDNGHALAFAPGKTHPFSASRDAAVTRLVHAGLLRMQGWMPVLTDEGRAVLAA